MKLSISYKHVEAQKPVEAEVERHISKLEKLLQSYSPDLVQLHGTFAKNPRTDAKSCTLNLSLPTGTLHATGTGESVRTSCKKAFGELVAQVKKASREAAERLRVEAETADRKHRSAFLNQRTAKIANLSGLVRLASGSCRWWRLRASYNEKFTP